MVCKGLGLLHERNIIHKDIKPQNILLMHDGAVKIVDFGISQTFSATLGSNTVSKAGTPLYQAPEVIKRQPFDQKVDMWALGCVIYFMASLRPPFNVERGPTFDLMSRR